MIQLEIVSTVKGYHPSSRWERMDDETQKFSTLADAMAYLNRRYGKCKRVKMHIDDRKGSPVHCGYIYCFRNEDISRVPVDKWFQRDWVVIDEVKRVMLTK